MIRPFYLHVTETTVTILQGRLTAEQLRQGRIQHYANGVTLHYTQGKYLVAEPQGYDDGSTLYREHRSLARAHRHATILASTLPGVWKRRAEQEADRAERHGVTPYTDAQRLKDAWENR